MSSNLSIWGWKDALYGLYAEDKKCYSIQSNSIQFNAPCHIHACRPTLWQSSDWDIPRQCRALPISACSLLPCSPAVTLRLSAEAFCMNDKIATNNRPDTEDIDYADRLRRACSGWVTTTRVLLHISADDGPETETCRAWALSSDMLFVQSRCLQWKLTGVKFVNWALLPCKLDLVFVFWRTVEPDMAWTSVLY